jgi:GNAT superfamily N-acetyltransferase
LADIRVLPAAEAERRLAELAAILVDAVEGGASVNFLAGLTPAQAEAFWRGQLPGLADGSRILIVAEEAARLVGTVVLTFAQQPNQPHRGEIGKMLVLRPARRRGIGRALLDAAEAAARAADRTLLILDTEQGSDGERLYRACGWTAFGTVPGYALSTDGKPSDVTFFYKQFAP